MKKNNDADHKNKKEKEKTYKNKEILVDYRNIFVKTCLSKVCKNCKKVENRVSKK